MPSFDSIEVLEQWLTENGIDSTQWGGGGTKTVANLWYELANEEMQLLESPPLRVVHVVEVSIRRGDFTLKELEQEFGTGQRRTRNRLPSEKIKPNESWATAALRCLKEELGVDEKDVILIEPTGEPVKKLVDSPSYPGLRTQYTFHPVATG